VQKPHELVRAAVDIRVEKRAQRFMGTHVLNAVVTMHLIARCALWLPDALHVGCVVMAAYHMVKDSMQPKLGVSRLHD
jgi:hypothetical protein